VPTPRARIGARLGLVAALILTAVGLAPSAGRADPPADPEAQIREVQARTDALSLQVDQAAEDVQEASLRRDELAGVAQRAQAEVAARQAEVDRLRTELGAYANAAYRTGAHSGSLQLLMTSGTAQGYLTRAADLSHIAAARSAQVDAVQRARTELADAARQADQDVAAQEAVERDIRQRQQQMQAALDQSTALLATLTAQEQARLAAIKAAEEAALAQAAREQAARDAAAKAARDAAARAAQPTTPKTPVTKPPVTKPPAGTGAAAKAVQAAYTQLGKPYVWAADGPESFDCSGLTAFAWAAAGVALPHSSRAQFDGGQKIDQADLQPGDLVFFGSPIHHVGLYVGDGQMIDAPQTGDVVRVQAAFRSDYVGATRP
jgi:cell wall-associated NlpC family hydrolase